MTKKVPDILRDAAALYDERGKIYGDNYKRHGNVMQTLFPHGVHLETVADHNRFGILTQVVAKLTRYCENFHRGGHADSVNDITVYSAMLAELDSMYISPKDTVHYEPQIAEVDQNHKYRSVPIDMLFRNDDDVESTLTEVEKNFDEIFKPKKAP